MATTAKRKQTTTEKGLGWRHQQAADALRRRHADGSACEWCGKPMYLDDPRNWDYNPDVAGSGHLQADHGEMTRAEAIRKGLTIPLPNRLLHRRCNQQRGDGVNDHLAVANRGNSAVVPGEPQRLAMPWP